MTILACTMLLVLSGCSSYTRDSEPGKVENITVTQMQEKIDKKESFIIVFTQIGCGACKEFKAMLDGYILSHNVTVYDVVLDEAPEEDRKSELETIRKTFPGMNATPSLYYVKDGKLENKVDTTKESITKDRFDDWVQTYKLDEKK